MGELDFGLKEPGGKVGGGGQVCAGVWVLQDDV